MDALPNLEEPLANLSPTDALPTLGVVAEPPAVTRSPLEQTAQSLLLLSNPTLSSAKENPIECAYPSTAFARSLKTFGWIEYRPLSNQSNLKTVLGVTAFDIEQYHQKCNTKSPEYDNTLELDKIALEVFKSGEVWECRDLAYSALEAQSECQGFTAAKKQNHMGCNRFGKPKKEEDGRSFAAGQLAANCTLRIYMSPLVKERYKTSDDATKWNYRNNWSGPIKLAEKSCPLHGGDCRPSAQNRIATNQRAGTH